MPIHNPVRGLSIKKGRFFVDECAEWIMRYNIGIENKVFEKLKSYIVYLNESDSLKEKKNKQKEIKRLSTYFPNKFSDSLSKIDEIRKPFISNSFTLVDVWSDLSFLAYRLVLDCWVL